MNNITVYYPRQDVFHSIEMVFDNDSKKYIVNRYNGKNLIDSNEFNSQYRADLFYQKHF